ncbi:MAG: hypothetical protein JWP27_3098 [Flaviaesturariibacter sp.]|nr:hypothetical protein [Flaviaesturariibacter sp.]
MGLLEDVFFLPFFSFGYGLIFSLPVFTVYYFWIRDDRREGLSNKLIRIYSLLIVWSGIYLSFAFVFKQINIFRDGVNGFFLLYCFCSLVSILYFDLKKQKRTAYNIGFAPAG